MGEDGDVSPLRESAIQLHEMYVELKGAGFSRGEAMELVARVMAQMAASQNEQKDE
jgi:hypothetical protein